jgi:hypothetical protein
MQNIYEFKSNPRYAEDGESSFRGQNNKSDPISKNIVKISIAIVHPFDKLTLNTDEGYLLSVQQQDDGVTWKI